MAVIAAGEYNPGSVEICSERLRVSVPHLFDNESKSNKSLETYEKLSELQSVDDWKLKTIILGLSTRNYEPVIKNLMDSFRISHSCVSNDFTEQSSSCQEMFENRNLIDYDFLALFIVGKYLAKEQVLILFGVTIQNIKAPIGFIQTATENSKSISELLSNLPEHGLKYEGSMLYVIDGSMGIHKAVQKVFSTSVDIQRCQWHKRENVLSYLPEAKAEGYRRRMIQAYNIEDYHDARQRLPAIINDLKADNMSVARSLKEGLDESLTLHRLGLTAYFIHSFSTTNAIENLNSQLGKYLRNVKKWTTSEQRYRWVASA